MYACENISLPIFFYFFNSMSVAFPHGFKSGARAATSLAAANFFGTATGFPMSQFNNPASAAFGMRNPSRKSGFKRSRAGVPLSAIKPTVLAASNTRLLDRVYKKVVALERKTKTNRAYTDLNIIASGNVPSSWTGQHLTSIAQGDNEDNRTGNEVFINSIELRGCLSFNSTTADRASRFRMVVVRIKNALAGTPPGVGSFLSVASLDGFYERGTAGTYQVLLDRIFTVSGVNYEPGSRKNLQFRIPVRQKTTYTSTTTGDYDAGSIWIYYIGEGWSTIAPNILMTARVNFQI